MQPKTQIYISVGLGMVGIGLAVASFSPLVTIVPLGGALCAFAAFLFGRAADTIKTSVADVTGTIAQNNIDKNALRATVIQKDAIILAHDYEVAKLNADIEEAIEVASTYKDRCIDLDLKCGYCGHVQEVAFNPNVPEYACDECKQTNALTTRITVSRITEGFDSVVDNIVSPLG